MNTRLAHPISVSVDRIAPLLAEARRAGLSEEAILDGVRLCDDEAAGLRRKTIPLADYYRVQNRLALLTGDETAHLSSRQLLQGSTDFVLQHVGDCENLYEAMRVIARSYNLLHGGQYNAVVKKRSAVDYVIDDRHFPYAPGQPVEYLYFSIECILIFLHCMLTVVSPLAEDAIRALQIRRPSPGGDCAHLGYWNASIRFGADCYRVTFDREAVMTAIATPGANALTSNAVYQKITDAVAGKALAFEKMNSAASRVRDALARGVVEQSAIAAQMGVSVATLRRRLAREGESFRSLRRGVLNERAKRLLLDRQTVEDVADALGFSDFRAFNRAFKDWNGMTPKAYVRAIDGPLSSQR